MKKALLVLVMGLCLMLVLSSCGGNETTENELTQNQEADFCWNADFFDLNFDWVQVSDLILEFTENNPGLTEEQLDEKVKEYLKPLILSGAIRKNPELLQLNIEDMTPIIDFLRDEEIEEIVAFNIEFYDNGEVWLGRIIIVKDDDMIIEDHSIDLAAHSITFLGRGKWENFAGRGVGVHGVGVEAYIDGDIGMQRISTDTFERVLMSQGFRELLKLKENHNESDNLISHKFSFLGNLSVDYIERFPRIVALYNGVLDREFELGTLQNDMLYPTFVFIEESFGGTVNLIVIVE